MTDAIKERSIPFTKKIFNAVSRSAIDEKRTFKAQASILIEEALTARTKKPASQSISGAVFDNENTFKS